MHGKDGQAEEEQNQTKKETFENQQNPAREVF